jgi:LmbE family N-acetylglucosaminyl deacetylase
VAVLSAHPDDPLWGAGGLMALLSRNGHEVLSVYGTSFRGDRKIGEEPEAVVRRREAVASCRAVGAVPTFFGFSHEDFRAGPETLKAVSSWLEQTKPDIVVTHWPLDSHENHHAMASLVWQCYKPQGGWNLYFYEVGRQTEGFRPDLFLDVEDVLAAKLDGLDCHEASLRAISRPQPGENRRVVEDLLRRRGAECGVARAEAFTLVQAKEGCPLLPVPFLRR